LVAWGLIHDWGSLKNEKKLLDFCGATFCKEHLFEKLNGKN
jgi:hypothetical protein